MRMKVRLYESNQKMKVNFGQVQMSGGEDGFSPIVNLTETDTGVHITITDVEGTKTATVRNGKDGKDGKNGQDGRIPVKGTDYFTAADKAELVTDVIAALPVYGGETA